MSTTIEPNTGTLARSSLPTGLVITTILVLLYTAARAFLLFNLLWFGGGPWFADPTLRLQVAIIPGTLLLFAVLMIILVFARVPAAKGFGIGVCMLNLMWLLYLFARFAFAVIKSPESLASAWGFLAINGIAAAVYLLQVIFLAAWHPRPQSSAHH